MHLCIFMELHLFCFSVCIHICLCTALGQLPEFFFSISFLCCRMSLSWHTGLWAPLVADFADYCFFLSPVFSLVEWQEPACSCGKEMMGWWQMWPISESCCVSQDEQVAMVYLPTQLGKALPLTTLPFSEMFGFTSGRASIPVCAIAKNIPWVPWLHCASQISYLSCWCTFPDVLLDQALACVPQWYKSELSWEDSLLPE